MNREQTLQAIERATKELTRSDRGRTVRELLLVFLDSPASQLDAQHWESVLTLIAFYRAGWTGAVLEELRENI